SGGAQHGSVRRDVRRARRLVGAADVPGLGSLQLLMRTRFIIIGVAFVVLLSGSPSAQGDRYAPFFGSLKWRSIGPLRGGRSITAAGSTKRPLEYYFGATGGGVWKTTDGGVTWQPTADEYFKTSSPGALAVSESNPDVVYVGMGETELRGNIIQGDGVYKSADAGKSWAKVG